MPVSRRRSTVAAVTLAMAGAITTAHADTFSVTYLAPGVQAPDRAALCGGLSTCAVGTETFDTNPGTRFAATLTSNGAGQSISGTFAPSAGSAILIAPADQYGGAGGTGYYPEVYYGTETLSLTTTGLPASGVNYFGLWISAMDMNNSLTLARGGTTLYTFTLGSLLGLVGNCPTSAYCGNPTASFRYQDAGEPFAFVNFFDLTGTFDTVQVSNLPGSGFESDNWTVGYRANGQPFGTAVPEPAAAAVIGLGIAGLAIARRRSRNA